jgi:hypothetical protein
MTFEKCIEHFLQSGFASSHLDSSVGLPREVEDHRTLTLLALHAAHPFRDFLCVLSGTAFE